MCAICRRYICPSACPSFAGESAELGKRLYVCSSCGEPIYEIDEYDIQYGNPYCKRCAEFDKKCEAEYEYSGGGRDVY